jgi:hypothetical protein
MTTTQPTPRANLLAVLEDVLFPTDARVPIRRRLCTASVCRCGRCGTSGVGVPHVPRPKGPRP